jgi:starvation-inducible outer membrane lipoprotein
MKSLLAIITALLLTACVSVPVERKFPSVPKEIAQSCPPLTTIDPATQQLSRVVESVVANYGQYQECDARVDAWIEWYNTQKKIFDEVK